MMDLNTLFPRVERVYTGSRWSFYFLIVLTALSTGRSLVHMLAADGGSHSIAGHLKPLQIAAAPPGSYGTYLVLLLATAFFGLSLRAGQGSAASAD